MSSRGAKVVNARDLIEVRPAGQAARDDAHRPFLVASLLLATLVGFVLGIHVPLGRLLGAGGAERTADLIQAHGQVQLLGFAGLFVMGMSLRLMPRFAGARIALSGLLAPALWLFVVGLGLRAIVMPWFSGDLHSAFLLASVFAVLVGSACFLLVTFTTVGVDAKRFDASSLAFIFGATLLFASALIESLAAIDAINSGARSLPYLTDSAIVQLQLSGFVLSFILGVALRAIPTMFGRERPARSAGVLAVLLAASATLLAASLLYLQYVSDTSAAVLLSDVGFLGCGVVLMAMAWQARALRQAANRIRPASQAQLWLVRSAFFWMTAAGIATLYFGGVGLIRSELPQQTQFDAVRHLLAVGVVTMLIAGMSMLILPEFAADRLSTNRQKPLAAVLVVLLNLAAALRVLPALAGTHWSYDQRNLSMAVAGSLAETALLIFTAYFLRLVWVAKRVKTPGRP